MFGLLLQERNFIGGEFEQAIDPVVQFGFGFDQDAGKPAICGEGRAVGADVRRLEFLSPLAAAEGRAS
jgi:hypothetical protein